MRDDQNLNSAPKPMPAPQLPNFPISPDDPFQSDPDLLPPVTEAPDRDPASGGQPSSRRQSQSPKRNDPDEFEGEPDDMGTTDS